MTPPETQKPETPDAEDLQRRRREIGRGLTRSHYAVVAATLLVGLLTIIAVWLSREAERRADDAQTQRQHAEISAVDAERASDRLWQIGSQAAALERNSRQPGQRTKALEIIREAAAWQPSRELRDEALSASLLPDFGTNVTWHEESGFEFAAVYDSNFEHFIMNNDRTRAIVRRADGTTLMDEKGFGRGTPFWQFSPDGRLAAIAFSGGQIGVWDWRHTNLLARFSAIKPAEWGEPPFDFSRDGKYLWLLTASNSLQQYTIESGKSLMTIPLEPAVRSVRLSPSDELAAVAFGQSGQPNGRVEIWDLAARTRRAALNLTNDIWRLAWQPREERLAIGCYGGLYLWDISAAKTETLRVDSVITVLFFSADGDLLFTGGWNVPAEIWNTRTRKPVLQSSPMAFHQLSADETRLHVTQARVGYGVQQYLAPTGLRSWPGPPLLGQVRWSADVDPQERWLLNAFVGGWLVRDAESGRELARVKLTNTLAASFSADGSNVLVWTQSGLLRWPMGFDGEKNALTIGTEQTLWKPTDPALEIGVFAADRRHVVGSQNGLVTVVEVANPATPVQFRLRRPLDNSLYLSPDGRWLITGHHNQHGLDWYDARAGKFVRTFATEGFANPVFDPHTGELFTCTAAGHTKWNLETRQPERSVPWRTASAYQHFVGFTSQGRLALVKATGLELYDLQAGRDFATLDFRDPEAVFQAHWSRDQRRIFLFSNDGGVTRLDLPTLRAELDKLGLSWPDGDPSREFPKRQSHSSGSAKSPPASLGLGQPAKLVWLVLAGLVVTIGIGFYILRYQRRLFTGYLDTEKLAEQRAAELRATQAALLHREKMEALGTMAAGVAHDFNNLLSVIRLSNELIEEQVRPSGVVQENFQAIQQAVQRGRGIVNSMLGYARDDGQPQWLAPGALISDAVAMLSKPFLSGLVLQIESDSAAPEVFARKARIGQMLLNLIINAAEAMNGRGKLGLTAREIRDAAGCVLPPRVAKSYIELSVADSGPGIAPEVLPRIFEPFFTTKTKSPQHGTGLGLSMLYTMAREDGIGVAVTSEPGRGATFRLLLPADAPGEVGTTRPLPAASEGKKTGSQNE